MNVENWFKTVRELLPDFEITNNHTDGFSDILKSISEPYNFKLRVKSKKHGFDRVAEFDTDPNAFVIMIIDSLREHFKGIIKSSQGTVDEYTNRSNEFKQLKYNLLKGESDDK